MERADYLRWCYYNLSNINFVPEVLEVINCKTIITKPGKCPELHTPYEENDKYKPGVELDVSERSKLKHKRHRKAVAQLITSEKLSRQSKDNLRSRSQKR